MLPCLVLLLPLPRRTKTSDHFHSTRTELMLPKEKIGMCSKYVIPAYFSQLFQRHILFSRINFELNIGPLRVLMEISIWLNCIFKQCFRLLVKNGKKHQDKCSTMVAIVSWLQDDLVLANHLMLLMSKFDLFYSIASI